jgi:hypothetical protein
VQLCAEYLIIYKEIFTDDVSFVFHHGGLCHACPPSMSIIPRKNSFKYEFQLSENIIFHCLCLGKTLALLTRR